MDRTLPAPIFRCCLLTFLALGMTLQAPFSAAAAGEVRLAVASNFLVTAREIAAAFEAETNTRISISSGSTGQLYVQISQGAPYDAFLAADQARPGRAAEEGLGIKDSQFTYATGRLVLYVPEATGPIGPDMLNKPGDGRIAIANPATAPYGLAAQQVLSRLGRLEALGARLVMGTNIAQTYQFVETGSAEMGFVALSQVSTHDRGQRWIIPPDLHDPIAQDAILLTASRSPEEARAFLDFLRGPVARAVIKRHGYN